MAILIYRSRLLTLEAFKQIKMHQGRRQGVAYSSTINFLNFIMIEPSLRKRNYIEYIVYSKNREKSWVLMREYFSITIICIVIFFRLWNTEIDPFILPWEYIALIAM